MQAMGKNFQTRLNLASASSSFIFRVNLYLCDAPHRRNHDAERRTTKFAILSFWTNNKGVRSL